MKRENLLGEETENWKTNFKMSKPKDHIRNNMIKMTIDPDALGASLTPG
jgi:hypothetical protein